VFRDPLTRGRITLSRWRHGFEPRWDYLDLAVAPLAGHSLGHFDRILIVGDRVLLAGHRGADRFTSVFTVDDGGVRRVQGYASVDAALDALKRPRT
jgi:hypothetical protein